MARLSVACLLIVTILPSTVSAGDASDQVRRRALLVGCTDYQLARLPDLWGPSNDVHAWSKVLVKLFGLAERDVRVLLGWPEDPAARPTRKNIVNCINELLTISGAGDQLVILLAGHGAQVPAPTVSPASGHVEADGFDEVFLPADVQPWAAGRIENGILDDEIGGWLDQFRSKGVHVWIVFDCCHASGLARPSGSRENSSAADCRAVHFTDLRIPHQSVRQANPQAGLATEAGPGWLDGACQPGDAPGSVVAFYACQGSELTPELPHPQDAPRTRENYYGLFSYSIVSTLARCRTQLSYRELYGRIESRYALERPGLPPRIAVDGALERTFLGLRSWPKAPRLALLKSPAQTWLIDGGELSGLTNGSILAVRPPAGDRRRATDVLGYLRVKMVGPITATVEPVAFGSLPPVDLKSLRSDLSCEIVSNNP
jgi:Caspase domain